MGNLIGVVVLTLGKGQRIRRLILTAQKAAEPQELKDSHANTLMKMRSSPSINRTFNIFQWLYSNRKKILSTTNASSWLICFIIGLKYFIPVYHTTFISNIITYSEVHPILTEILSAEDFLADKILLDLAVACLGLFVCFYLYSVNPEKHNEINNAAKHATFIFKGPSNLLFMLGFFTTGVAGAAYSESEFISGLHLTVLASTTFILPGMYLRWQSEFYISDKAWLRKYARTIAKVSLFIAILIFLYISIGNCIELWDVGQAMFLYGHGQTSMHQPGQLMAS
ncbi:hypothetical protein HCU74_04130 [Spongiibacter sp. KMU-166]|uniref:Uncharacterized protein n=1 Tax=Spongiibacter thalassae TaxID=2721624 RepID=A0ABX1GBR6_9GAMM|nr:hypothetical protein [Spongiibacter thalassae]NKI16607.1 hypothetical protein [Spongiibacter thalassae]